MKFDGIEYLKRLIDKFLRKEVNRRKSKFFEIE